MKLMFSIVAPFFHSKAVLEKIEMIPISERQN